MGYLMIMILTWILGLISGLVIQSFISRKSCDLEKNKKITRFEVIDSTGRAYTKWNCEAELSYQDEGRTLKVFITEKSSN